MDAAWFKGSIFGMPRWAWIGLLVGGVGVGLYLRSRSAAEDTLATDELEPEQIDVPQDTMLGSLDDPGLAGSLETVGPAAGSVVPYASPTIPEGYPETFGILGDVVNVLGEAIAGLGRPAQTLPSGTTDSTKPDKKPKPGGGGPPRRPDNKRPPKKVLTPAELEQYKKLRESNPGRAANYLAQQAGKDKHPVGYGGAGQGSGGRPNPNKPGGKKDEPKGRPAPNPKGSDRGGRRTAAGAARR